MSLNAEDLIGTWLGGRYTIVSEIGKGRSGVVYKALDSTLNRPVALKLMYENMDSGATLERFKREAMAAAALNHPNIVTVFDFGLSAENFAFLTLEFLEGQDLHWLLSKEDGRLSVARCVRIASQVCQALGHAHRRGVVHRDLKPSNIMLRDLEDFEDFVKIVDFGIARRFDLTEQPNDRLTLEGQVLGTPNYMSPEQCQSTRSVDARSDIYSLGCLLFRMMTGVPPVTGNSLLDIINGHLSRPPLTFSDTPVSGQVPADVQQVIMKALAKKPEDRQQSMFEMRLQLNAAFANSVDALPRPYAAARMTPTDGLSRYEPNNPTHAGAQFELAMKLVKGDGLPANPEESRRWMRAAAERGHLEAQYYLAMECFLPENNNIEEGIGWLRKAAERGFEPAQFRLAECFETGRGVTGDLPQAIMWYQESSRRGNKQAEAKLAACYQRCYDSGDNSEGMESWLRERAVGGEPSALVKLAKYLSRRLDAHRYSEEIAELFRQSAQRGDLEAQLTLASDILHPCDAQQQQQAYHWASVVATRNDHQGLLLQSICLKNGFGTNADPSAAIQLLEKAAELENQDAQAILGCALMLGDTINRNLTRGIALLKGGANDNPLAQWKLALCYKNGLGVTRDPRESERLFKLSAEKRFWQGPPWPFTQPGLRFEEALQTFQTLVAVDNKQAYHWLGICHEDGLSVPKDLQKALQFYTKAAQKGHAPSAEAVARLRGKARV